ncbi:hypothetical protein SRHO_G00149690 [Serrasalmus rhombeus]
MLCASQPFQKVLATNLPTKQKAPGRVAHLRDGAYPVSTEQASALEIGRERPGSLPSVLRRSPPTCPLTSTLGVLFIIPTAGSLSYLPFPMPHRPPTGLEQCLRLTHAEQAFQG